MKLLPTIRTFEDYRPLRWQTEPWLGAMTEITRRHGLAEPTLQSFDSGTHVVFRAGPQVIKLLLPLWDDGPAERLALRALAGKLSVPTPELMAEGKLEGWDYLIIERLEGLPLRAVWPELAQVDRVRLAEDLGAVMAEIHRLPIDGLEMLNPGWDSFIASQREGRGDRAKRNGLSSAFADELDRFLEGTRELDDEPFEPVLLLADIHWDHVLLSNATGSWQLAGLIDFADAMIGHPYYEMSAPAVFITKRNPAQLRAMLLGYGFEDSELTEQLSRRLLRWLLLHRYADIAAFVEHILGEPRVRCLAELSEAVVRL